MAKPPKPNLTSKELKVTDVKSTIAPNEIKIDVKVEAQQSKKNLGEKLMLYFPILTLIIATIIQAYSVYETRQNLELSKKIPFVIL